MQDNFVNRPGDKTICKIVLLMMQDNFVNRPGDKTICKIVLLMMQDNFVNRPADKTICKIVLLIRLNLYQLVFTGPESQTLGMVQLNSPVHFGINGLEFILARIRVCGET